MRRILALFTMLMLCGLLASAQNRVVSGKVTDKEGAPVSFASIKVKGTRIGAQADASGSYTIKVKDGDILEISSANYKTVDAAVGTQQFITTVLEKTGTLSEVVVTSAFGIKRTSRSVSANAQVVSGDQINTIRQPNLNNALAGKVAGVQVRSQSTAALDRQTAIRLRGESGLGGGSAIYVVDGTILPNSNDINTDDIEDVTVLQGPSASALFGAAGQFGAIVITLKKARKNAAGMGMDFNTGVQFDNIYSLTKYQNSYAGGAVGDYDFKKYTWEDGQPEAWKALDGKFYHSYATDESWGPRIAGQEYIPWYAWYPGHERSFTTAKLTAQPTNITDFYNTAVTLNNNVSFTKATDNTSIRFSYGNLTQHGLIPGTKLKRNTFNTVSSFEVSPKITLAANITYLTQNRNGFFDDGYGGNTSGSFNSWFHRDLDMNIIKDLKDLKSPTGQLVSWNHADPTGYNADNYLQAVYWFNPYSYLDNLIQDDRRDRLYGDVSITYKFNSDLRLRGAYRKQQNTTFSEYKYSKLLELSAASANNNNGNNAFNPNNKNTYRTTQTFFNREVFEAVFTYSKKIKNFNINANSGIEITRSTSKTFAANTNDGLTVPDLYTLNNSKSPITYADLRERQKGRALFVRGDVGFKNYLFGEFTIRKDYSSTLPPTRNSILVKSFGASLVFSELVKGEMPWLSFGKIRASWGQTPNILNPYSYPGFNYALGQNLFNGNPLQGTPNQLVDPLISGSTSTTKEVGLDLKFIKNRISLSVTYWNEQQKGFPVAAQQTGTTGFTSLLTNAGLIDKKGIDIQFNVKPIWTRDFQWDLNATWGKILTNKIVSILDDSITQIIPIAQGYWGNGNGGIDVAYTVQEEGKEWGQMYGTGIQTINGQRVVDNDPLSQTYGLFKTVQRKSFGGVLPNFTGGVQNTFTVFRNFVFNVNIDYQIGGKFYSLSESLMDNAGLSMRSATLNDKGIPVRDPVSDGGGVHVQGVDDNGKAVSLYVAASAYYKQNVVEDYLRDLSYVKLRELSFGYKIPVSKTKLKSWLQSATFSVVARNPWLIYSKAENFDPSEISGIQGEDAQFPATRGIGINLKLGF